MSPVLCRSQAPTPASGDPAEAGRVLRDLKLRPVQRRDVDLENLCGFDDIGVRRHPAPPREGKLEVMAIDLPAKGSGPRGTLRKGVENSFCNYCNQYVHAPRHSPGLKECPTPGCGRPNGFGRFALSPRPGGSALTGEEMHDLERENPQASKGPDGRKSD